MRANRALSIPYSLIPNLFVMFFLNATPTYVVYPGSGFDFTPLLTETQLDKQLPVLMESIRSDWAVSSLILCDNSPEVAKRFDSIEAGFVIYDKNKGVYKGEETYRRAWEDSPLVSLRVENVQRSKTNIGVGKLLQVPVTSLNLKATIKGQTAYTKVEFYYCDFYQLADYLANMQAASPGQAVVNALFLIGMPDGQHFMHEKLVSQTRFVVSDLPPRYFENMLLPTHVRLKHIGRQTRSYTGGRGAAIYITHGEFSNKPLPQPDSFWIIPDLFAARLTDPTQTPEDSAGEVINRYKELDEAKVTQLLDDIDQRLESNKTVLFTETHSASQLFLIAGAWLVRHGVATGSSVYHHITTAASLAGITANKLPAPNPDSKEALLLRNRVPGQ